jgi:hypothetical protein
MTYVFAHTPTHQIYTVQQGRWVEVCFECFMFLSFRFIEFAQGLKVIIMWGVGWGWGLNLPVMVRGSLLSGHALESYYKFNVAFNIVISEVWVIDTP